MCACGTEVETTEQFLLCCHFYNTQRLELIGNPGKVYPHFLSLSAKNQVYTIFCGSQTNNYKSFNHEVL